MTAENQKIKQTWFFKKKDGSELSRDLVGGLGVIICNIRNKKKIVTTDFENKTLSEISLLVKNSELPLQWVRVDPSLGN